MITLKTKWINFFKSKLNLMSKTIGIVTHITDPSGNTPSFGLNAAYLQYFRQFGNIILIDSCNTDVIKGLDLLVLPGGRDVNPIRYGESPHVKTQNPDIQYEFFDEKVLPKYIKEKTPIFGICRGFQTLNVFFGGKINQDIWQDYSGNERGKLVDTLCLNPIQPVEIKEEWINGSKKWGDKTLTGLHLKVNSLHHQGVFAKPKGKFEVTLSDEFYQLAYNLNYGNTEAICHKKLPIIAVQWHPEEMMVDIYSELLINRLLNNK